MFKIHKLLEIKLFATEENFFYFRTVRKPRSGYVGFENLLQFTYYLYQIPIAHPACFFSIRFSNPKIERAEKRKNEEN